MIGVVTFHASLNIGSMLQAYATKHLLEKRGFVVKFLRFSSEGQRRLYSLFFKPKSLKELIKNLINVFLWRSLNRQRSDFLAFRDRYLMCGLPDFSDVSLVFDSNACGIETIVYGSDQIWNRKCHDFDWFYFGDGAEEFRKVALAPSFGGTRLGFDDPDIERVTGFLRSFDAISVREGNGRAWLNDILDLDVEVIADPTLLVSSDVWGDLVEAARPINEDYLFFYGVPFDPSTFQYLKLFSEKVSLPVYMLDAKGYFYRGAFFSGFKLFNGSGPVHFLNLIKHAKMVVTTSFHGSIFAARLKVPFYALTFEGTNQDDDRLQFLLEQLNLSDRFIFASNLPEIDCRFDIDWKDVQERIDELQTSGHQFIDEVIGAA